MPIEARWVAIQVKQLCRLERSDFEKFGLTMGCAGCKAMAVWGSLRSIYGNSEQCRDRILQLMKAQEGRDRLERAERDARRSASAVEYERAERIRVEHLAERRVEHLADRIDEAFKKLSNLCDQEQAGAQKTKGRRTNN